DFDVASDHPLNYHQDADDLLVIEPEVATEGSVRVSHENLETVVPFIIFPSAFLTDNPERYTWVEGQIAPGISFETGALVNKDEADLYVEKKGELVAPYGFAKLPIRDPWVAFATEVDAINLEYKKGPFGVQGPKEAITD